MFLLNRLSKKILPVSREVETSLLVTAYLASLRQLIAERDEAIKTRNLAQEASVRDLEAKRAVEKELQEVREQLNDAWIENGNVYTRPTAWAYAQVCIALEESKAEITVLRKWLKGHGIEVIDGPLPPVSKSF